MSIIMNENASLPLLVIFGLDYTLWPYWMDPRLSQVRSPFSKTSTGEIVDSNGTKIQCYADVPSILEKLKKEGIKMAVTSYTLDVIGSHELIRLFDWEKYFSFVEIHETVRKVDQLKRIHEKSNIDYKDMIFFDDIKGNIMDAVELRVFGVHIPKQEKGLTMETFEVGLKEFQAHKLSGDKSELEVF